MIRKKQRLSALLCASRETYPIGFRLSFPPYATHTFDRSSQSENDLLWRSTGIAGGCIFHPVVFSPPSNE
jgi:hypothetical protein